MKIRLRRGAAAAWGARNPTLAVGEPGYVTDTGALIVGDGVTPYASLSPLNPAIAPPSSYVDVTPGTSMGHGAKHAATRLERGGDAARLRGVLVASAGVVGGNVIATIGTPEHRPAATAVSIARVTSGGSKITINTDGTIMLGSNLSTSDSVWLDGLTWDLLP